MAVRAHTMVVARDPSTGAVLTSATVNVYSPGTVTPIGATIFDKSGNVLSNPLTSDPTTGLVDFYLGVAQEVDLVVAKSGYTTRTYSNVPVIDDASYDLTALLTTTGDIAYASSANTPSRLAIGGTGAILTVVGGVPVWSNTIASGGLTITAGGLTITAGGLNVVAGGVQTATLGVGAAAPASGLTLANAAAAAAASQINLGNATATSATAGSNGAVPAQVAGYWVINVAGTTQKVPYFNS